MNDPKSPASPKHLWSGRFSGEPNQRFFEFNRSLGFDRALFYADVAASSAHVSVLAESKILTPTEAKSLREGLRALEAAVRADPGLIDSSKSEDIHSFIESQLTSTLGDLGRKLHTGRSRNDQVTTATKLWLRDQTDQTQVELRELINELLSLAESNVGVVIPGYTHLQRAQPILFSHWVLAYCEMLDRDLDRLAESRRRANVLPLGSGALAGSGLATAREVAQRELGFDSLSLNSLDAVSDRDYVLDWLAFASVLMVHLSRLCEDLIIYATTEFGFIELGDEVSSGSSLMPQKKNPDALELIRGKSGRVFGALTGMLATMKGLPMAYNKDLQEDKEALFDTVATVRACVQNMTLVLSKTRVKTDTVARALKSGHMNATDLADQLVKVGIPFREAHEKVGTLVRLALSRGLTLEELPPADLIGVLPPELSHKLAQVLSVEACLASKELVGGTGPRAVAEALALARKKASK